MAPTSQRDVQLVFKAKSEIGRVVSSVSEALQRLDGVQTKTSASGQKLDSTLDNLGSALSGLSKALRGESGIDKLGGALTKASAAVESVEKSIASLRTRQEELATSTAAAAAKTAELTRKSQEASAAQKAAAAAVSAAAAEQAQYAGAIDKAVTARNKLLEADRAFPATIEAQSAAINKATAGLQKLQAAMAEVGPPTKAQVTQFANLTTALDKAQTRLADTVATQGQVKAALDRVGVTLTQLPLRAEAANTALARQSTQLDQASTDARAFEAELKNLGREQFQLQAETKAVAETLERETASLVKAKVGVVELAAEAGRAGVQIAKLGSAVRGALLGAFKDQAAAAEQARRGYAATQTAVNDLARQLAETKTPTAALQAAFDESVAAARRAKAEFLLQRDALQAMRTAFREAGTDVTQLGATQEKFQGTLAGLRASLGELGEAVEDTARKQLAAREAAIKAGLGAGQASANLKEQAAAARAASTALGQMGAQAAGPRQVAAAAAAAGSALGQMGERSRAAAVQTRELDSANRAAGGSTNALAQAFRALYGESRQAMSFTQRLRGEILALTTSYLGLFGAVQQVGNVIDAAGTLDTAKARLNAAFDGNNKAVAAELDFVRRSANALKVEFGQLADQYSKFAVGTKGTVVQGEATRKIFLSVAQAGRVNNASMEDMQGIFNALTQIMSKGKIQAEELRGQLGDRLPGAVKILADGLGVTTAQLDKMLEAGEVSAASLVQFADGLDKAYGPGLQAALAGTRAAIGGLQNALFQGLVRLGESGFIERFNKFVDELTVKLQSANADAFFTNLGQAMAGVIDILSTLSNNIDVVLLALSLFAGVKSIGVFNALSASVGNLNKNLLAVPGFAGAAGTAAATAAGGVGALGIAVGGLRAALAALLSSTGVGLLVTIGGYLLANWATSADAATVAMNGHRKIVDEVKSAYDRVKGATEGWGKAVKNVTLLQAQENLRKLQAELKVSTNELANFSKARRGGLGPSNPYRQARAEIEALAQRLREGKIDVKAFQDAVSAIGSSSSNQAVKDFALSVIELAEGTKTLQGAAAEAGAAVKVLDGSATATEATILKLDDAAKKSNEALKNAADEGAKKFEESLNKLREGIPELEEQFKNFKESAKLDSVIADLMKLGPLTQEQARMVQMARDSLTKSIVPQDMLKDLAGATDGIQAAYKLIIAKEDFRANPYKDNDGKPRIGFGSDTMTDTAGNKSTTTFQSVTDWDGAMRDLTRRVPGYFGELKQELGAGRFKEFNAQQQAVLASLVHNYGELPDRIVKIIKDGGTTEQISTGIRNLGDDNGGINRGRRTQEAAIFSSDLTSEQTKAAQEQFERIEKKNNAEREAAKERADRFHEEQAARTAEDAASADSAKKRSLQEQISFDLLKAQNDAKAAGTTLTETEIANIKKATTAKYESLHADDEINAKKKAAADAESRVTDLMSTRESLTSQLKLNMEQGDSTGVQATKQALVDINAQLQEAIANAIKMYEAIGGTNAEANIARLNAVGGQVRATAQRSLLDWNKVADLFAGGLTNAFDNFAQSVANGESIGKAARNAFLQFAADFLREIAKMILQQIILNAVRSALGLSGGGVPAGHTGGVVGSARIGSGNMTRRVDPGVFANAPRFHTGGIAGLAPNEVPAVLKKNEEVLTENDPRHVMNGGGAGKGQPQEIGITSILIDDPARIPRSMGSAAGQRVTVANIRENAATIKSILGIAS